MVTTNLFIFLRTVVVLYTLTIIVSCNQSLAIESQVERALLNAKWEEVYKSYESRKDDMSDPVARMIMAHASLATNDNNLATVLFLSLDSQEQFESWAEYTDLLLENNPENPIALYISADASARLNRLDEAIEKLTKVLKLTGAPTVEEYMMSLPAEVRPDLTAGLAYDALGAVYDLNGQGDLALISLELATQWAPNLADAYASYGQHLIFEETSGEGVEEAFKKALEINPRFALAYNGLGCVYFGRGEFEKAGKCFERAMQASPALGTLPYSNRNLALLYASMRVTLAAEQDRPGMSLEIKQKILKDPFSAYLDITRSQLPQMNQGDKARQLLNSLSNIPLIQDPTERTETLQGLIKTYGERDVRIATATLLYTWQKEMKENTRIIDKNRNKIDSANLGIYGTFLASEGAKGVLTFTDLSQSFKQASDLSEKALKGTLEITKGGVSEVTPWPLHPFIYGVTEKGFKPISPSGIVDFVENAAIMGLEHYRTRIVNDSLSRADKNVLLAKDIAGLTKTFREVLGERPKETTKLSPKLESQIKLLISGDRPIEDIGRCIRECAPKTTLEDGVLIVSGDTFRTDLLTSLMVYQGLAPKVVAPHEENLSELLQKNDYKLAIALPRHQDSGFNELELLRPKSTTDFDTGPDFPDNYNRAGVSEPGLAERAALANKRSVLLNKLRWGSPEGKIATEEELQEVERQLGIGRPVWDPGERRFPAIPEWPERQLGIGHPGWDPSSIGVWEEYVPKNLGPNPGGIRTSDIGKAFTDKGNWPVATIYSLAYNPLALAKKETE